MYSLQNVFGALCSFFSLIIIYSISKYLIKPYLVLKYYQKQGGVMLFHKKLLSYADNYQNALEKGDFYYGYKTFLKKNPKTRFIVENFGDKILLMPIESEMIKEVLRRYEVYQKSTESLGITADLGYGTLTLAEGHQWRKQRKMVTSVMNYDFIKAMVPMMVEVCQEKFAEWEKRGDLTNVDLVMKMGTLTGDITGRFFFGKRFSEHMIWGMPMTAAAQKIFDDVGAEQFTLATAALGANFARKNILPRHRELNRAVKEFRAKCKEMIRETEESTISETNILKLLLEMEKNIPEEDKASHEQIVGEFLGLFIAGTDTTALMVACAIYYLSKHPHALQKVKEEVDREMKDLDNLSLETLNRMDYTTAVMKETLRFGASVAAYFFREAVRDDELCGVKVKKGTIINIFAPLTHHLETLYTSPHEFIPERWLGDPRFAKDGCKNDTNSFLAFSVGPRNCVGQHIAMIEGKIILGTFLKAFNFEIPKNYEMKLVQKVVLIPAEPLMVSLEKKK